MIWVMRARVTPPRRASSARSLTSPESTSPWKRCARAMSRETRGMLPKGRGGGAGASPSASLFLPWRLVLKCTLLSKVHGMGTAAAILTASPPGPRPGSPMA